MIKRTLLLFIGLLLAFFTSQAQEGCVPGGGCEVCDNGIDDNGDSYTDIGDPLCAEFYGLTFTAGSSDCSVPPPDTGIDFFSLAETPISSAQNTVDDQSKIVVGDVNNDGIPDAVATTRWGFQLSVFATTNDQDDGKDEGDEKSTFKYSNSEPIFNTAGSKITPELETWIADIGTFDASGNFVSDTPDGISEIFGTGSKRVASGAYVEDYFFVAFTYQPDNLVPLYDAVYMSKTSPGPGSAFGFNNFRPGIPGITDFDGDGKAEIYIRNRIYAAETGYLLADGGGDWISEVNAAPVAANIIGSQELELICGNLIYDISSVNLTNRTPGAPAVLTATLDMNSGTVTKLQSPGQPAWSSFHPRIYEDVEMAGGPDPPGPAKAPTQKFNYSSTSVADVNNDGSLDVFLSGAIDDPNGVTAVFFWNVAGNKATAYEPIDPDDGVNWQWGTGRVNIKDLDGDAKVEANFVSGDHLFALEESGDLLTEMWTADLKDALSGIVSTTVYDFENDGRPEIVVRDSKELRMHDGLTGALVNSPPTCESHTLTEGPIVVDYNGDGDTDICVSCFTGPGKFKVDDNAQAKLGGVNLFNSSTNNWLPTRRVWNQGPYFVVNIRDDLSIPFPMGDQTTIFGTGDCDNGLPGPQRPLNMFLNQVPTLGPGGCPIYPAPDIAFGGIDPRDPAYDPTLMPGDPGYIPPTIEVIPPICGELEITVNFNITNDGSLIITDDIPVSFWAVDPTDPSVTPDDRLHTEILSVVNFQIGEIKQFSDIVFNSTGESFTLYIVLNDKYATTNKADLPPFLPLSLDDPDVQECKINNNIFDFPIIPQPFEVQTTITPNVQCDSTDPNEPENGTITAVVFEGGSETTDYGKFGFEWYTGNDTIPANQIPRPFGPGVTRVLEGDFSPDPGVADGLYTLVVTNLDKGCQSLPRVDTVELDDLKPDIQLIKVQDQSQCERPPDKSPDGAINSVITGGPAGAVWEYNWVDDNLNPYNITTQNATGLSKGIYILEVALQGSNCIFNSEPVVVEGPEIPDPNAITLADASACDSPNGEVTAEALISGVPQDSLDYDFIWRESDENFITNGSLLDPVAKNPTRKGLDPGYYVVQAIDKNTGCETAWAITQVGNLIKIPEVTLTELAPQTSCDPANPNGRIQVDITIDGIPQDPSDFTIEWFRGDNTIPPVHANTSGVNGEIAEGVDALVFFTVKVTSALECSKTDKIQISETKPVLAITSITMSPNSTCDETLASSPFTGSLTVDEITVDGVPTTDFTGYTFTWYEGNDILTATEIVGETTSNISQREDGDYLVVVSQDNTSCASPEVLEPITAVEDLPVIIITETPESTCTGTPNGIMSAAVDVGGVPTTAGYTFEWFDGDEVTDPPVATQSGSENQDAIELAGNQNYTVRVTNNTTGCSDFFTEFLDKVSSKPVIDNLTKVDNTICLESIGFTGSITATVSDPNGSGDFTNATEYDINWYQGETTAGPSVTDPDLSTPLILEGIEGNWYTLEIVNKLLGCTSIAQKILVEDKQPTLTVTFTKFPSTNCDPGNPATANGSIIAAAWADINLDGIQDPAEIDQSTFEFNWYEGNGTGGTQLTDSDVDPNSELVENIQGGAGFTYTIEVTHTPSGCVETQFPVTLGSAPLAPTISFTTLDDTGCVVGKSTGQITTLIEFDKDQDGILDDITNDPDYNFDYSWTGPNGYTSTKGPVIGDPTNADPLDLGLEDGDYSLTITEASLGCTFNPLPVTVDDAEIDILYDLVALPSTNCQPAGTPDGSIYIFGYYDTDGDGVKDVSEGNDQTIFTFNLYDGLGTAGAPDYSTTLDGDGDANAVLDTFEGLQGGPGSDYTLEIVHNLTGCTVEITVPLPEQPLNPDISFVTTADVGCQPGKFTGDITTTLEIDTDGDGIVDTDITNDPGYSFSYSWSGPNAYSSTDPITITGLEDGDYTVTITEANSGCSFTPPLITVDDAEIDILYDLVALPSTNCQPAGTPDGSIYIFGYYDTDGDGVKDVAEGNDQTIFTFNLYDGLGTAGAPDYSTTLDGDGDANAVLDTFEGLQGGPGSDYTLEIVHNLTGCTVEITVPLPEQPLNPDISFVTTADVGCQPGKFTGDITTTLEIDTDGDGIVDTDITNDPGYSFSYSWSGPNAYSSTDPITITGLEDGDYTVTITEANSGCSFTPPLITVDDAEIDILYDLVALPSTNCQPAGTPDGSIYIFGYYDTSGDGVKDVAEGSDQTIFTFNLYDGLGTAGAPDYSTTLDGDGDANAVLDTFEGLQGGPGSDYTLEIVHNLTGCTVEITVPLPEQPLNPDISFVTTADVGCQPGKFTGDITTTLEIDTDGDGIVDTDITNDPGYSFSYSWSGPNAYSSTDPITITGLEDGDYTVTITEANSGCSFTPPLITVDDAEIDILYDITTTPSTNCQPAGTPDGTIYVFGYYDTSGDGVKDVAEGSDQTIFTFNLYDGLGTAGAPDYSTTLDDDGDANAVLDTFEGLQGGPGSDYTLEIVHNLTGCTVEITVPLPEQPLNPTFSFATTDNAGCTPGLYTGDITTTVEIDTDGDGIVDTDITNDPDYNFSYNWTGPNAYSSTDPITITGLEDGDYSLTISEANSGCSFTPPDITVDNGEIDILYDITTTPSTNCQPAGTPDGTIYVFGYYDTSGDGVKDAAEGIDQRIFTFNLYDGTGTKVIPDYVPTLDGDADANAVLDTFEGLQGGPGSDYTLEIVHDATGCAVEVIIPLPERPFVPTITFTTSDNVACTAGLFTGQITTAMTWDDDGDPLTPEVAIDLTDNTDPFDFTYVWRDAALTDLGINDYILGTTDPNDPGYGANPGVEDGDYTVEITETNTGCVFTPPDITVDNGEQPILIFFTNTRNSSCATPNGELLAGVDFGFDGNDFGTDDDIANLGDYQFEWFKGSGTNPVDQIDNTAGMPGIDDNNAIELEGNDFYTVKVLNTTTGCVNTFTEFVKKVINLPTISINVTDYELNVDCSPQLVQLEAVINNQLDVDANADPLFVPNGDTDFIYTWYEGSDDTGTLLATGSDQKILFNKDGTGAAFTTDANKLTVGNYTLKVQHIDSQCESDIVFDKIDEPPVLFDITPTLDSKATTCDNASGKAFVTVAANGSGYGVPPGPLTYEFYAGAPTNTSPVTYYAWDDAGGMYIQSSNVPTSSFYTDPEIGFGDLYGVDVFEVFPAEDLGPGADASLSGVENGVYTVVVEDANGCKEYISFEIPFLASQQNNVITVNHDTSCDIQNGEIDVTLIPPAGPLASNFDIYLFKGTNPLLTTSTDPPAQGTNSAAGEYLQMGVGPNVTFGDATGAPPIDFNSLDPGVYTVASILNNTFPPPRCWSTPSVITIEEWAFDPSFTVDTYTPNTSCDPGTPDGKLTIDIQHNPSELPDPPPTTYQVFAARAVTPGINEYESLPGLGTGLHEISAATNQLGPVGLDAVEYIVTVTSDRLCSTQKNYTIEKQDIRPDIIDSSITDPNTCEPNGEARINEIQYQLLDGTFVSVVSGGPAPNNFDSYNFSWYLDDGDNSFDMGLETFIHTGSGDAFAVLDNADIADGYIGEGTYWVIVENNDPGIIGLGCESQPFQFKLTDQSVEPTAVSKVVANTACSTDFADGVIWIDPDRNGAVPPFAGSWSLTFTDMPSDYDAVGGSVPTPVEITAPTPNVAGEAGVFLITGVLPGSYEYFITDGGTLCPSDIFSLTVPDQTESPIVENNAPPPPPTIIPQYICNPDGSIEITSIISTASGDIDIAGAITAPDFAAQDLRMDNYTFTWYFSEDIGALGAPIFTAEGGVDPLTDGNYLNTNTYGTVGEGSYWVEIAKNGPVPANPDPLVGPVTGGGGCTGTPFQIIIDDERTEPTVEFEVTANTACDEDFKDGTFLIDPNRNMAVPGNYPAWGGWTVTITVDPDPSTIEPRVLAAVNNIGTEAEQFYETGVLDGLYKFTIRDDATNCTSQEFQLTVPGQEDYPDIVDDVGIPHPILTPQYICNPDGSIEITSVNSIISGSIADIGAVTQPAAAVDTRMDNYTFTWYFSEDIGALGAPIFSAEGGVDPLTDGNYLNTNTYGTVGEGSYWVEIAKNGPVPANPDPLVGPVTGGGGCTGTPFQIIIEDERTEPTVEFEVTANTACDEDFKDGTFLIDPNRNMAVPGNYPAWGGWTVTITVDPDPSTIEPRVLAAVNNIGTEAEQFYETGVLDGLYKFTIRDDATNCTSQEFQLTVPSQEDYPDVVDDVGIPHPILTPQYICNPDGSIEITSINSIVSGSIADIGAVTQPAAAVDTRMDNYTFTWYFSEDIGALGAPIFSAEGGVDPLTDGNYLNTNTYGTVGEGSYWVEIAKNGPLPANPDPLVGPVTGGGGCTGTPFQIIIEDERTEPTVEFEVTANTACDEDFKDGTFLIDPNRNMAVPGNYPAWAGWTVTITQDPDPTTVEPRVLAAVNNIGTEAEQFYETGVLDGLYKFTIRDDATNCTSQEFQLTVPGQEDYPDIVDDVGIPHPILTPQYICNPDGSIEITSVNSIISGSIADIGAVTQPAAAVDTRMDNYTFTWYFSEDIGALGAPIFSAEGGVDPLTDGNYLNTNTYGTVGEGSYWVEIAKNGPVPANPDPLVGPVTGGGGCTGTPFQIIIEDERTEPTVEFEVTANTACDEDFKDGTFLIDPNRNMAVPGNYPAWGGWTVTITVDPDPSTIEPRVLAAVNNIGTEAEQFYETGVLDGLYKFTIRDDATNCTSQEFQLTVPSQEDYPDVVDDVGIPHPILTPQYICNPDGSIEITSVNSIISGSIADIGAVTVPAAAVDTRMDNYTFTWYFSEDIGALGAPIFSAEGGVDPLTDGNYLNTNTYGTIGEGSYWVEIAKNGPVPANPDPLVGPVTGGGGCTGTPFQIIIEDARVEPSFIFETTANTSCDAAGADGSFYIDPDRNGAAPPDYPVFDKWTITFTSDPYGASPKPAELTNIPPNELLLEDDVFSLSGLIEGIYEFTITDEGTGCSVNGQLEVPKLEIFPYLDNSGYVVTKQFTCNPDGSITINSIESIQSGSAGPPIVPAVVSTDNDMSEYLFTWYRGSDFTTATMIFGPDIPGGFDATADGNFLNVDTYPDIAEDTYWLTFTKTTPGGIQCESSPEKFIIESDIDLPVIDFTQTSSTSCAPVAPNGRLEAVITAGGVTPAGGINYTWYVGDDITDPLFNDPADGTIDGSILGQQTLVDVAPGIYTLIVEDVATGCFTTSSYEVLDLPVIPNISLDNVSVTPQDICDPSGSIVIVDSDISIGSNPGFVKDFWFTWSLSSPSGNPLDSISSIDGTSTGLPIQGPVLNASIYANMSAGDYFVTLTPKAGEGAGCPGPPRKVTVPDISTDPQITFTSTPNSSCPGGTPNGIVIATVQEEDGTITDPYIYTWTVDGNPVDPLTITDVDNVSTVIDAVDGTYSLTVENQNTGCFFTKGFELILDRTLSEPNIIRVDKVDPIDCNPTARMEVIEIQLGGQPANVGDFEYRWYQGAFDPANLILTDPTDPASPPVSTPNLENIAVGKYFVTAIELITNCESLAKEVNILEDNIIYPEVEITQDRPQTSCDVNNPNGQLSAVADGLFNDSNSNGDYSFTWFDESGAQIGDSSTVVDLGVGIYTVEVLNNITGCTANNQFIVEDGTDFFRLQVALSTEPVTFCNIDNGVVEARIANHNIGNWQFTWSGPNGFTTVESGNTSRLDNVEPGEYMVSAIDLSGDYCPSLTKSITVEDDRVPPPIDMTVNSQLTNCYVDDPNGQITATANGAISGYEFNWYSGTTVSGTVIETANIISNLPVGDYTVEIIDRFTRCAVSDFRSIEDATVLPPTPQAIVLNHLTDCLNPDGAVQAIYEGNPNNFDFFWYDGNSSTGSPANEETSYSDLDLGDYTLTVMDLSTGCVSEGFTIAVNDERVYPEFNTEVVNANCDTSNGSVEIQFDTDYNVKDIIWNDESGFMVGAGQILNDQPAGNYSFDVTTFKNCEASGTATIGTEITNYNGISANNDGSNDGFQIDCITLFPNNNVKIFNRAGVLVYEEDGYNNDDVIFEGVGLNGLYLAGQDLPDGTYFYIIDKGDGSRQVTGYLELIR